MKSGVARRRAARRKPASPANVLVVSVGDRRIAIAARRIIEVARVAGYTSLPCDDASNLGVGMYRSLGFEELCDIGQYVWVPEGFSRT